MSCRTHSRGLTEPRASTHRRTSTESGLLHPGVPRTRQGGCSDRAVSTAGKTPRVFCRLLQGGHQFLASAPKQYRTKPDTIIGTPPVVQCRSQRAGLMHGWLTRPTAETHGLGRQRQQRRLQSPVDAVCCKEARAAPCHAHSGPASSWPCCCLGPVRRSSRNRRGGHTSSARRQELTPWQADSDLVKRYSDPALSHETFRLAHEIRLYIVLCRYNGWFHYRKEPHFSTTSKHMMQTACFAHTRQRRGILSRRFPSAFAHRLFYRRE